MAWDLASTRQRRRKCENEDGMCREGGLRTETHGGVELLHHVAADFDIENVEKEAEQLGGVSRAFRDCGAKPSRTLASASESHFMPGAILVVSRSKI